MNKVEEFARLDLEGDIFSSPVMIGGRIFVGCRDDYVRCIKLDIKQLKLQHEQSIHLPFLDHDEDFSSESLSGITWCGVGGELRTTGEMGTAIEILPEELQLYKLFERVEREENVDSAEEEIVFIFSLLRLQKKSTMLFIEEQLFRHLYLGTTVLYIPGHYILFE